MIRSSAVRAAILIAGLCLFAPALDAQFLADDYAQLSMLDPAGIAPTHDPLDLYAFATGAPRPLDAVQGQLLPWWSAEELRVRFMRPLTGALHALNYAPFGPSPLAFHAVNLLIWGALLWIVLSLYQQLAGPEPDSRAQALLAGAFFALDEAHVLPVFWPANRHSLLAVLCCALALRAHLQFRTGPGGRAARVASLGLFVLGLLAGETALGFVGWIAAYEAVLGRGSARQRIGAAAPFLAVGLAYLALHVALGFGVAHSAYYLSPFEDPLRFAQRAVLQVLPAMLTALLLVDAETLRGAFGTAGYSCAAVLAAALAAGLVPALRRDRTALFMALAAALSALPAAATSGAGRHLPLPSVASAWVLAAFALACLRTDPSAAPGRRVRAAAVGCTVLALHGLAAPALAAAQLFALRARAARSVAQVLSADLTGAEHPRARVLLLSGPSSADLLFFPFIRELHGRGHPGAIWPITLSAKPVDWSRGGPRTLVLRQEPPGFLVSPAERGARERTDFAQGELVRNGALAVHIQKVEDGRLLQIAVETDLELGDPDLWILHWQGGAWRRIPPEMLGAASSAG